MRCIIAGSRYARKYEHIVNAVKASGFNISIVVSGKCRGFDELGELWAAKNNKIVDPFPADWNQYGRAAGPIRNRKMAENAHGLIALWDGKIKNSGTKNMIDEAIKKGLQVYVHRIDKNWWVSSEKMTFGVKTVDNIITDAAPIGKKFIGQHFINLLKWMKKQGGLKVEQC